ncbi:MAG TPA: NUDIX hydrolase [Leptolyngbyaceae cyanobacterium M33_DOE_097]|uniref:NUDIX domain-containing protein n=1 Tax=Oscillatoriales cyanobacterium SpSt-418 TaxID=2282169 RepID=A0A7C3PC22_9CYAN|nr:NUDIX hydrolase [Leptolyngbyaceae cyanobacterium M33_DOE_097]
MATQWLQWAQKLQAIAQNGLTYTQNPFDIDRYQQIQQVAAEMMANVSNLEPDAILELFQQESGYATPKVDVRGAVFQNDKILLVKELFDGFWTLPGGYVDIGEPPSQAIEREVFEESGYQTKAIKLLAVYDRNHPRHNHPPFEYHIYKLFFLCELLGGSPVNSIETEAASFFAETEIPDLSLSRVVPSQISRLFDHYRNPDWQTDFD